MKGLRQLRMRAVAAAILTLLLAVVLLAAACESGGEGIDSPPPAPTNEPHITATPLPPTPTLPSVSACPDTDSSFCDFAEAVDRALRIGDTDFIVANSRPSSRTCTGEDLFPPCAGKAAGTILEGFQIAREGTEFSAYLSEGRYRPLLQDIAKADASATDEYGDGTWRLAAVRDFGPEWKVLVSTSIGPDPIYELMDNERRVFLWVSTPGPDGWGLDLLLTTVLIEANLTGTLEVGLGEDWFPWGAE